MNIKDLDPNKYKVIKQGDGKQLNINDLAQGSYTVEKKKGVFSDIGNAITTRFSNAKANIQGTAPESVGEPAVVRGLQATAQPFGLVTDAITSLGGLASKATGLDKANSQTAVAPNPFEQVTVPQALTNVPTTDTLNTQSQKAFGLSGNPEFDKKINEWSIAHPDAAKNLDSVLKGAGATGEIANSILGVEGGVQVAKGFVKATASGVSDLAASAEQGLATAKTNAKNNISNAINKVNPLKASPEEQLLNITKPSRSTRDIEDAINAGGEIKTDLFGNKTVTTARDLEVNKAAASYIDVKAPLEANRTKITDAISTVSEKRLRPFLKENPGNYNYTEFKTYLDQRVVPTNLFKADDAVMKTFNAVRKDISDIVAQYPKTNEGIWEARKAVDSMIKKQYGDAVFGTEKYNAIQKAALDSRNAINDFIADNLATGDISKVNRIQEILNEAQRRGVKITNIQEARKAIGESIGQVTPDEIKAAYFRSQLKEMNLLYEAKENITGTISKQFNADKLQKIMDNPKYRSLRNILIGAGIAGSAITGGAAIVNAVDN